MKFKNKKFLHAFSFVEVMVAVFLVSVGLLAALKLLTGGLSATMDSRNQLIGSLLAQEGTELVRSIRDNNWANGEDSFSGINIANEQRIDCVNTTLRTIGRSTLARNANDFYINPGTGIRTKFSRKIDVTSTDSNQRTVLSIVTWNGKLVDPFNGINKNNCSTANKCAYAEDVLTNWGE